MGRTLTAIVFLVATAACGSSTRPHGTDANGGGGDGSGSNGGDGGLPGQAAVYAHTANQLYKVDPDTYQVTMVGTFDFGSFEEMTDLAIDSNGNMIGVSFFAVYKVDPTTAHCTQLSNSLSMMFNGLSFVPATALGMTGPDVLVGTETGSGNVYKVDPTNGQTTMIGSMGGSYSSSGDLVSVDGFGTVQTVPGSPHGVLVTLAPNTFHATPVGTGTGTGFDNIWGVGFWKGKVFGFTNGGQLITIDPNTGVGTMVATGGPQWYGAAVTTTAPVIP